MSVFEDAWEWTSDKVEDVWDATGAHGVDAAEAAIRAVPGGDELIEAAGDFAHTAVGVVVLRAFSSMLFGSIAWAVGPQLASVTFAVPGLFRGDRFDEAWLTEFKWRVEKTAETLGPGIVDIFGEQLKDTLIKLASDYGIQADELIDMGVQEVAKRFDIREDVAAFAISIWNKIPTPPRSEFDPATGRQIGSWLPQGAPAKSACDLYNARRRQGVDDVQLRAACSKSSGQAALEREEFAVLYGTREHELLYGARERAAIRATEEERAPFVKRNAGTLALAVVLVGGLIAWRRGLL